MPSDPEITGGDSLWFYINLALLLSSLGWCRVSPFDVPHEVRSAGFVGVEVLVVPLHE